MPAVGSSRIKHARGEAKGPGHEHLLLVAPREAGDRCVGAAGDDPEVLDPLPHFGALGAGIDAALAHVTAQGPHGQVLADIEIGKRPEAGSFARHRRQAGGQGRTRASVRDSDTVDRHHALARQTSGDQ